MGQNDCVGHLAPEKRALELAAFKPTDRTAQNTALSAATADRSVKPAYDDDNLRESTLTDYRRRLLGFFDREGRYQKLSAIR